MKFPEYGKVLFTATLVRGHIAKFHLPYLKWFKAQGWETWVAAKNDYPDGVCEIPYCDHFINIDFARDPFSRQTIIAYNQLRKLFSAVKFDLVHTHTPVGSVLTRLAARDARKTGTIVIYTAHGFHFYKGAPIANWLLWYPIERVMSYLTDILITINREDFARAKKFSHSIVRYVPGVGIDLQKLSFKECRENKRIELGFVNSDFVLLSVADLTVIKNQISAVEALPNLSENVKLAICGEGPEKNNLLVTAKKLHVDERVRLFGFRNDISEIMSASDALVFPSIREGLPVSIMEAMASKLPVIASSIRGIDPDLLRDHDNGLLLKKNDSESISQAVEELLRRPNLSKMLSDRAYRSVRQFGLENAIAMTTRVYSDGVLNARKG